MKDIEPKILAAKVYCLKGWIQLIEPEELDTFFQLELEKANFTILNFTSNKFPHNGYTAVWVLAESHLAIHSFTDSGWTYFELTSCNQAKSKVFKQHIVQSTYRIQLDRDTLEESAI